MLFLIRNKKNDATHILSGYNDDKCDCGLKYKPEFHEKEEWSGDYEEITCTHCKSANNTVCNFYCNLD